MDEPRGHEHEHGRWVGGGDFSNSGAGGHNPPSRQPHPDDEDDGEETDKDPHEQ